MPVTQSSAVSSFLLLSFFLSKEMTSDVLSSPKHKIFVDVKVVGVLGCSASGKSTAAHQLAQCLGSPLYPISTDQFFLDEVCAQLGTYDDYRCLDYAKITQWMHILTQPFHYTSCSPSSEEGDAVDLDGSWKGHEAQARDEWCAAMLLRLPDLKPYFRVQAEVSAEDVANASAEFREDLKVLHDDDDADDDSVGDDDSLCAHEAEEAERRANAVFAATTLFPRAPSRQRERLKEAGPSTTSSSLLHRITMYVVWEGFTLLCSAAVNAYVDVAVHVRCDFETACLRRFFRSPRHHLVQHAIRPVQEQRDVDGNSNNNDDDMDEVRRPRSEAAAVVVARVVRQLYRTRIEQMWTVRSRTAQREELLHDILQELREEITDDGDGVAASSCSSLAAGVRTVECLLGAEVFNPPRPGFLNIVVDENNRRAVCAAVCDRTSSGRLCWTDEGTPTLAFQHFWENEFESWLLRASSLSGVSLLSWAALGASSASEDFLCDAGSTNRARGARDERPAFTQNVAHASTTFNPASGDATTTVNSAVEDNFTGRAYVEKTLAERGLQALRQGSTHTTGAAVDKCNSNKNSAGSNAAHEATVPGMPSPSVVAKALAPFYYEFRYWFFFEVLYYDRLLAPLQHHRLRHRSTLNLSVSEVSERRWWTVENGHAVQGKKEEELLQQIQHIATSILSSSC